MTAERSPAYARNRQNRWAAVRAKGGGTALKEQASPSLPVVALQQQLFQGGGVGGPGVGGGAGVLGGQPGDIWELAHKLLPFHPEGLQRGGDAEGPVQGLDALTKGFDEVLATR